ncbi:hypothetical protein RhiirA5_362820 [Rhizophagus irregularis]|uniref:Uncharacterized protein n=1 Tax=Rhizophagus irregularis TaxID=588596 RepID=A0A2I1ET55_9GLOM|nr:hypothetical protein RhiirA5_364118 [Rhizophagus irregularis]PKC03937.1 hypothetical protein RhiirA5_362820 [Rhizophagus irregularis]PKC70524.1 hypothetical protein RhiirA1_414295 [Rhizophagus irregularis]PKY25265.1 hypothetical protein RhiirB3_413908 [Rhizophagus irregularis]
MIFIEYNCKETQIDLNPMFLTSEFIVDVISKVIAYFFTQISVLELATLFLGLGSIKE